jgi:DNA topoisomerase 2-associated protein PAT1
MINYSAPGMKSLAEIEAEMRAATLKAREAKKQEEEQLFLLEQQNQMQLLLQQQQLQQLQLHQQQQLQQQQTKPPRMRAESPAQYHGSPLVGSQSAYGISNDNILREVEKKRLQEHLQRSLRNDTAFLPTELQTQNLAHVDPVPMELLLQQTVHRSLPQGTGAGPIRPPTRQQRYEELINAYEQDSRMRVNNVDDIQSLRRQIALDQHRQTQLAAAGLQDQRRESPMDQLQHQLRLAMANEMASKARGENAPNPFGANPSDIAQMQLQQRMLAQLAQQEFAKSLNGTGSIGSLNGQNEQHSAKDPLQQDALRAEAMRKIMEAEQQEARRRKKAAKIAHMVCIHIYIRERLALTKGNRRADTMTS